MYHICIFFCSHLIFFASSDGLTNGSNRSNRAPDPRPKEDVGGLCGHVRRSSAPPHAQDDSRRARDDSYIANDAQGWCRTFKRRIFVATIFIFQIDCFLAFQGWNQ